mgnify:CR=1 FL=1
MSEWQCWSERWKCHALGHRPFPSSTKLAKFCWSFEAVAKLQLSAWLIKDKGLQTLKHPARQSAVVCVCACECAINLPHTTAAVSPGNTLWLLQSFHVFLPLFVGKTTLGFWLQNENYLWKIFEATGCVDISCGWRTLGEFLSTFFFFVLKNI